VSPQRCGIIDKISQVEKSENASANWSRSKEEQSWHKKELRRALTSGGMVKKRYKGKTRGAKVLKDIVGEVAEELYQRTSRSCHSTPSCEHHS